MPTLDVATFRRRGRLGGGGNGRGGVADSGTSRHPRPPQASRGANRPSQDANHRLWGESSSPSLTAEEQTPTDFITQIPDLVGDCPPVVVDGQLPPVDEAGG